MTESSKPALGFSYRHRKGGEIQLFHRGKLAATLRGSDAAEFLAEAVHASESAAQQLMARLTGNYRRGNKRTAAGHPRNQL